MLQFDRPFPRATKADAKELAVLLDYAGAGLPSYLWSQLAAPGESRWEVGRRHAEREEGSFSYRNAVVAEEQSETVAALIGYQLISPSPLTAPPVFFPMQELEN